MISKAIQKVSPKLFAKIRGKNQSSTRDLQQWVKRAEHIEYILDKLGYTVKLEKQDNEQERPQSVGEALGG